MNVCESAFQPHFFLILSVGIALAVFICNGKLQLNFILVISHNRQVNLFADIRAVHCLQQAVHILNGLAIELCDNIAGLQTCRCRRAVVLLPQAPVRRPQGYTEMRLYR